MNLPNKLTILRACMIPVFVVLALQTPYWAQIAAAIVFALASFTDYLDGHIARKHNLVTNFGKFMDPIADKLLVMSAFVVLVGQGRMPSWACIIVLGREFVISGFRLVAADAGRVIAAGRDAAPGARKCCCASSGVSRMRSSPRPLSASMDNTPYCCQTSGWP